MPRYTSNSWSLSIVENWTGWYHTRWLVSPQKLSTCFNEALLWCQIKCISKGTLCTSGYPLASIKSCTQFKQTHRFLLEAWEAVYWVMLTKFLAYFAPDDKKCDQSITEFITQTILSIQSQSHEDFWKSYIRTTCRNENLVEKNPFQSFIQSQATVKATKKAEGAREKGFMRTIFPTN